MPPLDFQVFSVWDSLSNLFRSAGRYFFIVASPYDDGRCAEKRVVDGWLGSEWVF